ncbi:MAG: response regulator [Roseobacter sp.]
MAKLLIMEDDVILGFRLTEKLEEAGHEVDVCKTASAGIELLWQTTYDVLVSDIIVRENGKSIPDGGFKLIGWARNNPKTCKIPIIAVTGTQKMPGMGHMLSTAEQIGANACLEKPFNVAELLDLVDRLMALTAEPQVDALQR